MMKKLLLLITSVTILLVLCIPQNTGLAQSQPTTEAQIETYLNEHPLLAESGAAVLSVERVGEALVIDLSREILPEGIYDETVFTQLQNDLDAAFQINQVFLTTFKVEGELLEAWGRPAPDFSVKAEPPLTREEIIEGPLTGYKIALSPGHGLYWHETYGWLYQRGVFNGIQEDTLNPEIMLYLQNTLLNQGATVIQTREMDFDARTGISGYPAWHEDARQYAIYMGLPSWVWDGSNTNYNSDIRTRPYTANYYDADVLISFHNNGWDGTLSGTETYYDTDNNPGSQALATAVHNSIINTIRSYYDSDWVSRGIKASDSAYGEINYAQMPAALIELAFMDTPYPDNAYLHDETFKQLAAIAIAEGICDYLGVDCDINTPLVIPEPTLEPPYGSGVCDSGWFLIDTDNTTDDAYLMLNVTEEADSRLSATWQPNLPTSGEYQVEVFIPYHANLNWSCPGVTTTWDTSYAAYELTHANGVSRLTLNQAPLSNEWVDLGTFHFNSDTIPTLTLTDVTGESHHTTSVSASRARFTLVGHAGEEFYNTAWLDATWVNDRVDVPVDNIRNFLKLHHSCLANPILDSNGADIDLPTLLQQAAATNQISPKLLLAVMEAEQKALSECPDSTALSSLMGLTPVSTASEQISLAAQQLGNAYTQLISTGTTPNGWVTGVAKATQDGVTVVPANDSITVLFDYMQTAGSVWGGELPDEPGVQNVYIAYRDYLLDIPLPTAYYELFITNVNR